MQTRKSISKVSWPGFLRLNSLRKQHYAITDSARITFLLGDRHGGNMRRSLSALAPQLRDPCIFSIARMVRARCTAHHRVVGIGCSSMSAKNSQTIDERSIVICAPPFIQVSNRAA
ncbi:MAG: hypothetical protein ABR929_03660 [Roseiarcus sp.]|jgi:hypothetical protein